MKLKEVCSASSTLFLCVAFLASTLYYSQLQGYKQERKPAIANRGSARNKKTSTVKWRHRNGSINFDRITMAKQFVVTVVNPQQVYHVGSELFIEIVARDAKGRPKSYGGDFLRVKMYSRFPVNASSAGRVTDYGNGTYIACFLLSWPGNLSVSVQLIHSSEAVQVLKRCRDNAVDRRIMGCIFPDESSNITERMPCSSNINRKVNPRDVCDFSKPFINATFYCQRPRLSHCNAITDCQRDREKTLALHNKLLSFDEQRLFSRDLRLEEQLPNIEGIQVNGRRMFRKSYGKRPPLCGPGLPETQSEGYWYNGTWFSLRCRARTFPTVQSVLGCLQNKSVFFFGDSTTKQWWLFLKDFLNLPTTGSTIHHIVALSNKYNTKLEFTFHHFPRNARKPLHFRSYHYVAEEIDKITGGPNVVIFLGLWGHYTAEPIETFRSRLYGIRHAVDRLSTRYPDTKIIWRTSNTRNHDKVSHFIENSDWYAYQILLEAKNILESPNIADINVWEMTSCMWHNSIMHVPQDVVKNQVDLLLSYVCPL